MAASFGSGIGGVIGGVMARDDLNDASNAVNSNTGSVRSETAPYNEFGTGLLNPTSGVLMGSGDVIPQSLYDRTSNTAVEVILRQIDQAGNYSPQAHFKFTLDPAAAGGVLPV